MAKTRWLDEQEMAAWIAFLEVSHRVFRSVEAQLKEDEGLSHAQYEILVKLSAAGEAGLRMTVLADSLITPKSGLTYQVGRLEQSGLVTRTACDSDVRGVTARITPRGLDVLRAAAPGHVARVREVLIDLMDRPQLLALADALGTVNGRLREGTGGTA
ncbi:MULTISPECIES: MarR family winged helix-turn-helix transcriptional regulator [Streptomyces]|uniref:DNA-binding transcriptional regulator, MarR family n=1 Tax=Streptomyces harbinensis TaxID=1176198 RepID=A0A1I6QMG1_9ACTN|nr:MULTISPECIES: MarR family transcriptional regulator [Streptomyces]SFS53488.1 DNA-binding transcriptional regulator, MarR family [Streptomyces harbinensis]